MPEEQQTQDDRAQVPLEEQTVPRVIRLMETGRGWQPYSVQARIAVIIMTQIMGMGCGCVPSSPNNDHVTHTLIRQL